MIPLYERLLADLGGATWPRAGAVAFLRRRGMGAEEAARVVGALLVSGHLVAVGESVRQPRRTPEESAAWSVWTLVPPGPDGATADRIAAGMALSLDELRAALDLLVVRGCLVAHDGAYHRGGARP